MNQNIQNDHSSDGPSSEISEDLSARMDISNNYDAIHQDKFTGANQPVQRINIINDQFQNDNLRINENYREENRVNPEPGSLSQSIENRIQLDAVNQYPESDDNPPQLKIQKTISEILCEGGKTNQSQNADAQGSVNRSKNQSTVINNKSNRDRKEAKRLQKYDSNSIDEEEFQDYFSNPQKRKEFDRQRLQQQMKEVQNIAGFSLGQFGGKSMKQIRDTFPSYPGADVEQQGSNIQQKNYATVSLCCLSVTNPFRNKVIQLVAINPWFDRFILVVIIVNCFFLALDNEVALVSENGDYIDLVFLFIYTLEMILKVIAMGFFMRAHSYLRDSWNILDFVVVILGWVSMQFNDQNISAIRVIRIMRPLRTINSMPGMSSLVSTILNSLPIMFDIMILFIFMLIMFGTITTQLLGGKLENRCFAQNALGEYTYLIGANEDELFCFPDKKTGEHGCAEKILELDGLKDPETAAATAICDFVGNPSGGTFSFDNILLSVLNIFQIITLEGWTDMMYVVRSATDTTWQYDFIFYFIVLFGAFFVLNLMIAVQFTYLGEAFDEEERKQKENKEKIRLKKKIKEEEEYDDSFFEKEQSDFESSQASNEKSGEDNSENSEGEKKRAGIKRKGCLKLREDNKIVIYSNKVENLVNKELFQKIIIWLILLNTLFLASEHHNQSEWLVKASDIANIFFTVIFAIEMVLKLFGLGLRKYCQDGFNIFDAIIVIISVLELLMSDESSGLSVLRAFRLVRIFKLIKSWKQLRQLLGTVLASLSSISNLGVLTLLFLFIFSLIAKQFFSGQLLNDDGSNSRYDFSTTQTSLTSIFIVLTGENWNEIMIQVIAFQEASTAASIFFIISMMLGNYMLLNLFLAILLKFITDPENKEQDECTDHLGEDQEAAKQDQKKENNTSQQIENVENNSKQNIQKTVPPEGVALDESGRLNSSNSNIEEEFEQIKAQLQQLSNMNLAAHQQQKAQTNKENENQIDQQFEGGDGSTSKSNRNNRRKNENNDEIIDVDDIQIGNLDEQEKERDPNAKGGGMLPIDHTQLKSFAVRSVIQNKKSKKKTIDLDEDSKSLYIFGHKNPLRVGLKHIVENSYFENFIYHCIAFNSVLLALDTPALEDPYQQQTIQLSLEIISIIFIVEFVLKVIVMGFFKGPNTYLRDNWNILDFTIVFFSMLTWVLQSFDTIDIQFIRGFRALRALRPLRVVSKNEGIKTVVNSLLNSIPALLNVLMIIVLFLLVFGILGVQLFKGSIAYCTNPDESIAGKETCNTQFELVTYNAFEDEFVTETQQSTWVTPFNNYNDVFFSMITFFEISTLEMWPDMMFNATDSVGPDLRMEEDNSKMVQLIYVVYIFLATFFIMNLFISVIVDKFNEEIKKRQGAHNFSEEQKEWVKIQRLLVHTNPKIIPVEPINCFRLQCFKIVQSQAFEYIIMTAIVINTLFLCIDHYHKGPQLIKTLDLANYAFVIIFTFEMIIKITAYGFRYYWHVNWNKFDFIIVIMSLVFIDEEAIENLNFNVTALRIIRVSRLLRMVKTSEGLRSLLKTLYMSLGNIFTTASLLLLILFTFTVAGMSLFGQLKDGEFINDDCNFKEFYKAMSTLWRACTGESWNGIMHDCYTERGTLAIGYWLVFQLITFFIFMNVFIAVIYENFSDIQASEDENDILSLKKKDIKAFQNTWAKYNPMGELYMRTLRLPDFLRELPPPLGYQGIRIEESKLNKIIFCLNIKDHLGRVYYPEVMWTIFHSIVGINDEKVNRCEQICNILKIVKRKYKGLGKKVNLDSLCGNKYYRNELTAIKYIQAMKILTKWRNFKNMRIKQKENAMIKQMQTSPSKAIDLEKDKSDIRKSIGKSPAAQGINITPVENISQQKDSLASDYNNPNYIRDKRMTNIGNQIEKNREENEYQVRKNNNKQHAINAEQDEDSDADCPDSAPWQRGNEDDEEDADVDVEERNPNTARNKQQPNNNFQEDRGSNSRKNRKR